MIRIKSKIVKYFIMAMILLLIFYFYSCEKESPTGTSEAPKTELEGTWVGYEVDGFPGVCTLVISRDNFDFNNPESSEWYKGTIELDTSTTPKQVDLFIKECFYPDWNGNTSYGIYKLEADTLTFAGSVPGIKIRPTSFTPGDIIYVWVFGKRY